VSTLRIGVTSGLRGYFAVLYNLEEGPIQTGIGSYKTAEEAWQEAEAWARADGYQLEQR
jgi:hypothetical protein